MPGLVWWRWCEVEMISRSRFEEGEGGGSEEWGRSEDMRLLVGKRRRRSSAICTTSVQGGLMRYDFLCRLVIVRFSGVSFCSLKKTHQGLRLHSRGRILQRQEGSKHMNSSSRTLSLGLSTGMTWLIQPKRPPSWGSLSSISLDKTAQYVSNLQWMPRQWTGHRHRNGSSSQWSHHEMWLVWEIRHPVVP